MTLTVGALWRYPVKTPRRLRPNIVIDGVDGMDEIAWPGAELHIGDVVVALDPRRGRCSMTTVDPNTLAVDRNVLKDIVARFDGKLALNANVVSPGIVHVGDAVRLAWPAARSLSGQPSRLTR